MGLFATLPSPCARHAAVAAAAALAVASPLDSANAGFFDFLFSPQPAIERPMMSVYPGRPPPRWRAEPRFHKRERSHLAHRHPIFVEKTGIEKGPHSKPPHLATNLMDDDSLQEGDAVMTQRGIRIFIGSGEHHRLDDFVDLSEIKGLSRRHRSSLAAIEAPPGASGRINRQPEVVTGRSAADPDITAGAMITDSKGRRIRYVGP